eukprot:368615-Prymnesium_polylepis.2
MLGLPRLCLLEARGGMQSLDHVPRPFGRVCLPLMSEAPYDDAFGAIFWPSDVDYAGLTSLIGRFEDSDRSGSSRSFDCRIVIGGTRSDSRVIDRWLSFFGFFGFPFHAGRRPRPPVPTQGPGPLDGLLGIAFRR